MIFILNNETTDIFKFNNNTYFINTFKLNESSPNNESIKNIDYNTCDCILDIKQTIITLNILVEQYKNEENYIFLYGKVPCYELFLYYSLKNIYPTMNIFYYDSNKK